MESLDRASIYISDWANPCVYPLDFFLKFLNGSDYSCEIRSGRHTPVSGRPPTLPVGGCSVTLLITTRELEWAHNSATKIVLLWWLITWAWSPRNFWVPSEYYSAVSVGDSNILDGPSLFSLSLLTQPLFFLYLFIKFRPSKTRLNSWNC